ncbi:MAG: NAD(P)H-binding protein [Spongiibacteraceae bacterium]
MIEQKKLLIIGCGDIGNGVAELLMARGWQVQGLRRNTAALAAGVLPLQADVCDADSVAALGTLSADYVLFTLTPAANSEEGYRQVFEQGVQRVLAALSPDVKRLFFVSSSGVYDQSGHDWIDESSETAPSRFSGRALLRGEQLLAASPWPSSVVRFTGIYGPGREQMLNKVIAGECAPELPVHYTNRIHRDDCVGFLTHLILRAEAGDELADCYLGSDDEPTTIQQVQSHLADALAVKYVCAGTAIQRTGSKRCRNDLLKASGYQLQYPTYREGFASVVAARQS